MDNDDLPVAVMVDDELNEELLRDNAGELTGFYYVGKDKYLLPSKYAAEIPEIHNFEVRKDDVWLVTFPRSGTTLSQELIWMLLNNFDYELGQKKSLWERTPFFEFDIFFHEENKKRMLDENEGNTEYQEIIERMSAPLYDKLYDMDSPRLIKTHLPLSLLPKGVKELAPKIIYVARNPKDVLPSYFYLLQLWRTSDYVGTFLSFWKQFKAGHVPWSPFWPHVIEGWEHRHDENVLFIFYEDMMKDMHGVICEVANFLDISVTDEQVAGLVDHLDIKNFSKNPAVNFEILKDVGILNKDGESFVRKGDKRKRPEEMSGILEEIDEWIEENYQNTDLRFPKY